MSASPASAHNLLATSTYAPTDRQWSLAQKVLVFASNGWIEIQIKQLLLRAFRNEAARQQRTRRPQLVVDARPQRTAAAKQFPRDPTLSMQRHSAKVDPRSLV
jgi:hypothetical protein